MKKACMTKLLFSNSVYPDYLTRLYAMHSELLQGFVAKNFDYIQLIQYIKVLTRLNTYRYYVCLLSEYELRLKISVILFCIIQIHLISYHVDNNNIACACN